MSCLEQGKCIIVNLSQLIEGSEDISSDVFNFNTLYCYNYLMQQYLGRRHEARIHAMLDDYPAVMLFGARQVGKTILAHQVALSYSSGAAYDLDNCDDWVALRKPTNELLRHAGKLIRIDAIQRSPSLLRKLRFVIDEMAHRGKRARFLLFGSDTHDLQRETDSLEGRLAQTRLHGLDLLEIGQEADLGKLWIRGGFPRSYFAESDAASVEWRLSYLDRMLNIGFFHMDSGVAPYKLGIICHYLAAMQGSMVSTSGLATTLKTPESTVTSHIRYLKDLMMISELPAYFASVPPQSVEGRKYYICDSGLLNAMNKIISPNSGGRRTAKRRSASWEGFVLESIRSVLPLGWRLSHFGTSKEANIDLIIEKPDSKLWAAEIMMSSLRLSESNMRALEMLLPERAFLIHGGSKASIIAGKVEALPLADMMKLVLLHNDHHGSRSPAQKDYAVGAARPAIRPVKN